MSVPSVRQIARYWLHHGKDLPVGTYWSTDVGEPVCMACSWWPEHGDPLKGFERAHVVPRARGGSDDLPNLALFCSDCHADAPDTTDPDWFWAWVAGHERNDLWARHQRRWDNVRRILESTCTPGERARMLATTTEEWESVAEAAAESVGATAHFGHGRSEATLARIALEATRMLLAKDQLVAT